MVGIGYQPGYRSPTAPVARTPVNAVGTMFELTVPTAPVPDTLDRAIENLQPVLLPRLTLPKVFDAFQTAPPVALESWMLMLVALTVPLA